MTDRELAMSGALLRAVMLLRAGWSEKKIYERILAVWPGSTGDQAWRVIALAKRGIDYADRINWRGIGVNVDLTGAPQLPQD